MAIPGGNELSSEHHTHDKKPRQGQGKVGIGPESLGKGLDRLDRLAQHAPQQTQGLKGFRGGAEDGFAIGAAHFPQGSDQVGQGDALGDGLLHDSIHFGGDGCGGSGGGGCRECDAGCGCHWCVSVGDSVIVAQGQGCCGFAVGLPLVLFTFGNNAVGGWPLGVIHLY
jgi:hypothetical protein